MVVKKTALEPEGLALKALPLSRCVIWDCLLSPSVLLASSYIKGA